MDEYSVLDGHVKNGMVDQEQRQNEGKALKTLLGVSSYQSH